MDRFFEILILEKTIHPESTMNRLKGAWMEAKLTWNGKMSFTGLTESNFSVPLDAGPDVGGDGLGPRPMELLAISLAGCTAMDVISIMKKKQQQVTSFEVRIRGECADHHPEVFTHIVLEYVVTGRQLDPAALDRAIQLSAEKYCPVQAMLRPTVTIEHRAVVLEAL
jgi:putative redox protein